MTCGWACNIETTENPFFNGEKQEERRHAAALFQDGFTGNANGKERNEMGFLKKQSRNIRFGLG